MIDPDDLRSVHIDESFYPANLAAIADPPDILYVRGNLACLEQPMVAVFGTREPTDVGLYLARTISAQLAKWGFVVVSGLAKGIDQAAHRGALSVGGPTIAVMAHGLHMVYPAEHRELADDIVVGQGALVSEHAYGVAAAPRWFPRRNRIQSGLSRASILIESDVRGGSMHTCRHARDQGRLLLVVVPQTTKRFLRGGAERAVHEFGAVPVTTMGDIELSLSRQSTSFQTEIRRG